MSSRRTPSSRTAAPPPKGKSTASPQKPVKGRAPAKTATKSTPKNGRKGGGKTGPAKAPLPAPERRGAGAGVRLYAVIGGDFDTLPEPQLAVPVISWRLDATEAELRAFAAGWRAAAEQVGIPAWADVRTSSAIPPVMRDTGMLAEDDDWGDEEDEDFDEDGDIDEDEEDDLFGSDDD